MGAWDNGPFDNDVAADWCGDLDEADPAQRPQMLADALSTVVTDFDYIDNDEASVAIAAAAIVAAQKPGGLEIDSPHAPDFMRDGARMELPDELSLLAARALERVTGDESEWRDLWEDADGLENALIELEPIKSALAL